MILKYFPNGKTTNTLWTTQSSELLFFCSNVETVVVELTSKMQKTCTFLLYAVQQFLKQLLKSVNRFLYKKIIPLWNTCFEWDYDAPSPANLDIFPENQILTNRIWKHGLYEKHLFKTFLIVCKKTNNNIK